MASISTTDARNLFTVETVAHFSDRVKPMEFLRSFFKETESNTKNIAINVERDSQAVAVDVIRGSEGNRNTWDKSTEKIFTPPYYNEFFDVTELECYDELHVNGMVSSISFGKYLQTALAKLEGVYDKIDRAYELQASQVLFDGIVQLKNGTNINFMRKAASLIAYGAANDWNISTVDPNTILAQGAKFLKEVGKMTGSTVNVIMGSLAWAAYINNPFVKARALAVQWGMDALVPAQKNAKGQSYHGQVSVDSYNYRFWTYPEIYKDPVTGLATQYVPDKKIVMLPEMTAMTLSYAAVPQLLTGPGAQLIVPKKGKFLQYEFVDERLTSHVMGVKSAGVAIPVAVDQIFTAQVVL